VLLYSESAKTIREFGYEYCEMAQVTETAVQMRHDLESLSDVPYKNHRPM
jgi:hypothetical protein